MSLTKQEIFDAVWKQAQLKDKCLYHGTCLYRRNNDDGTCSKCFIGAIIPDDLYASKFEARPASDVLVELNIVEAIDRDTWLFANALQRIHDSRNIIEWNVELVALASNHKLVVPV